MKDCPICCEPFNRSTRKGVSCNYCHFKGCRSCNQTYILQSINEPSCMSCKVPWGLDFIWQSFTHVFYNTDLENHRANILFEREKLRLPETQHRLYCDQLRLEVTPLEDAIFLYESSPVKPVYYDMLVQRVKEIRDIIGYTRSSLNEARKKVDTVVRGCPEPDCKGFIMKQSFRCGVCSATLCHRCHVVLTATNKEGHVCKEEDVETAKILTTNTKPCPKCREMIFKIDGCDQMWCTMCHTAFSWKTGEIENHIHNPHYYEWMRRNGQAIPRADGDQPQCNPDGMLVRPDVHRLSRLPLTPEQKAFILGVHRLVGHMEWDEIARMTRYIDAGGSEQVKELLREQYLRSTITEVDWKKTLISNLKKTEKWTKVRDIMQLFNRIAIEQLHLLLMEENIQPDHFHRFSQTIEGIRVYCNEAFLSLTKQYPMVPYAITRHWGMVREKKTAVN